MKILFIAVHLRETPFAFPLSSALLSGCIQEDSTLKGLYETEIQEFYLDDEINISAEKIIGEKPDIAAFSIYIWSREYILDLIHEIKKIDPGICIIAGGAEVTADPFFFGNNKEISWTVSGEGEEVLLEFLKTFSNGEKTENSYSSRKAVKNIDSIPSPIAGKILDLSGYEGILWELSRGCPFSCDFCFESKGENRVRKFSLDRIEKELEIIKDSGIKQVFVLDPTFNIDRKRALAVLALIKKKAPDIHFIFEARSEYLDEKLALLFSEITCSVQIGLQSGNPLVLRNINRTFNKEDFFDKILFLHEAGAVYGFDLIYGLPGDSLESFLESLDFSLSMVPNHIDIFPLAVLKGTALYERADSFGIQYRDENPYTVISTPDFSAEDIKTASEIAGSFDLFYNRGKAVSFFSILTENLNIKPSDFFMEFSSWGSEQYHGNLDIIKDENEILDIQKSFITYMFEKEKRDEEALLFCDIITHLNSDTFSSDRFDMEKIIYYLESGITDLSEILFFCRNQVK